jgi:hypothetical protein
VRRPVAAVATVLVGLAAVVLASRGTPGDRTAAAWETGTSGRSALLAVLAVAVLASLVLAIWALWPDGSGEPKPPTKTRLLPYVVLLAIVLVLSVFAPERVEDRPEEGGDAGASATTVPEDEAGDGEDERFTVRASPKASLLATALGVAVLVGLVVASRVRAAADDPDPRAGDEGDDGPEGPPALPDELRAQLASGDLDGALALLRDEPDPLRAVLLAYAVLAAHLEGTPAARPRAATPHEWLQRIRRLHEADRPQLVTAATHLTAGYERARFAAAPVTEAERVAAVDAVRSLAADRAPATSSWTDR